MVTQVATHALDKLNLLVRAKSGDGQFQHVAHAGLVHGNEGVVVHVGEESHDELAVHTVGHASMSGNGVTEILDLEASLESRGEETTEGGDEGGERCEDEGVQLHRSKGQRDGGILWQEEELRQDVGLGEEDGVGIAFKTGENVGSEVLEDGQLL